MAPPRKPLLELESPGAVGFKTTSLRLQQAQWAQLDLFARAMGMSANECVQKAVDAYLKALAKKPDVRKALRKQITQQKRLLDNLYEMTGMSEADLPEVEDEDDNTETDDEGDFEEIED